MNGRVCLVTGATSGIGKEIARDLAKMGATVVLVGRDREKCESATREMAGGNASYLLAIQRGVRWPRLFPLYKIFSAHPLYVR